MKKIILVLLIAASVCKTTGSFAQIPIPLYCWVQDSIALKTLWDSTGGPNWVYPAGAIPWFSGVFNPVHTWYGITMGDTIYYGGAVLYDVAFVTSINLSGLGLAGHIPFDLVDSVINQKLANLQVLDLSNNSISDTIPNVISQMTGLYNINLSGNQLTGRIPYTLGNLFNLQYLDLSNNQLTNTIPAQLFNNGDVALAINLFHLNLSNNKLSGSIPSILNYDTNLQYFNLSDNQLSGNIPYSIGEIPLNNLQLNNNQLTGAIPIILGNLFSLQLLDLSSNNFIDSIPSQLGNLTNLQFLDLSGNPLSGSIPSALGNLINLHTLFLGGDQLTGSIPTTLGNLSNLQQLEIGGNQLSGSIPLSLGNLSNLQQLEIGGNQLTDTIPASLGQLNNLKYFDLDNNQLSGSIPASLGQLNNLQYLFLDYNQLSDSIPSYLGQLSNCIYFDVAGNHLSGKIPTSLTQLNNLSLIGLNDNQFTFSGMEQIVEKFSSVGNFLYAPQASIPLQYTPGKLLVSTGGTLSNNTYKWYNGSTLVATGVGDSILPIPKSGNYSVAVTNAIVTNPAHTYTDLILYSDTVNATSVAGDTLILPDHPKTEYANLEVTDNNGWTDYYSGDTLLLSLQKNGQNIGTIGDGTFQVKLDATAGAGSNTGIKLTNPLITNQSGFWVMNRYWQVTTTAEPTAKVGVRFYYNKQDLADINGSYPNHNLTNQQLIFYKEIGGSADPTTNLAGATGIISILPSTYASDTTWTYHQLTDSTQYAEFSVASFSGGGGGGTGNDQALPIKLLGFTATKEGSKNLLQWTTVQEVNSSYFEVERSGDGVNYKAIGQVNGAGNSSVAKNYSLVDAKPVNGMNYYRLKMVDKDGQSILTARY